MDTNAFVELLSQVPATGCTSFSGFARHSTRDDSIDFSSTVTFDTYVSLSHSSVYSISVHEVLTAAGQTVARVTLLAAGPDTKSEPMNELLALGREATPTPSVAGGQARSMRDYSNAATYAWPGPLACGDTDSGCSGVVDAGSLGSGRFCDYVVVCAGLTSTIFYNEFQPIA